MWIMVTFSFAADLVVGINPQIVKLSLIPNKTINIDVTELGAK